MASRAMVWDAVEGSSTVDTLSAGASAYGSHNTITNSTKARILGTFNGIEDSDFGTIIGDQNTLNTSPDCAILGGKNYTLTGSTYKTTAIPNDYVVTNGCIRSDASALGGTPVYQQIPTVTSIPTSDNDVNTRPIPGGSLTFCSADNKFYTKGAASTWHDVKTSFNPQTLEQTLAAGNTTSTNDIVVSSGQQITYKEGVQIGVGGATTGTTSATGINIGDDTTVSNGINTIAIGSNATTSTAGGIAIGERATVFDGVAIGSVAQATGARAVCIGQQSTTGTGSGNVAIGHTTRLGDLNTNCLALGFTATSAPSCANTILIGDNCGTGATSTTDLVSIGTQNNVQNSQTVKIGRGLGGKGAKNSAVGDSVVLTGTANNCSVLGASNTIPTGVTGATVVGSTHTITGTPTNLTCVGYTNTVSGVDGVAVGRGVTMSATDGVAIGRGSIVAASSSVSIGPTAQSNGTNSVAIGIAANSGAAGAGPSNIAIGNSAIISGTTAACTNNIAIGTTIVLSTNVADRIAIGRGASASVADNISIGRSAVSSASSALAVGTLTTASASSSVAVGTSATCASSSGVTVGASSSAGTGGSNVTVGAGSTMTGLTSGSIIVGQGSTISAASTDCIIIGRASTIDSARVRAVCLGAGISGTNVTADDAIYTPTTFAASAAGTAVSWDPTTGRLHPNTSSIRYKQNVQDYHPEVDILQIVPKTYNFKKGYCGCGDADCDGMTCGRVEVGFIAESMQEIFPLLCTYSRDEDGNKRVESIQYDRLVMLLIPEVKRLRDRIEQLEARLI